MAVSLFIKESADMKHVQAVLSREKTAGYIFVLPFILGLFLFTVFPFFTSLYLAFTDYNILSAPEWIGFSNFTRMFQEDKLFWQSFGVTFKFALIQVPVKLLVSLGVALLLSRQTKATSFYRAAFYIPSLMGGSVAVALTWKQLFAYNGVINHLIGLVGIAPLKWLNDPNTALEVLIGLGVWQFGGSMLIFLAAIKNVPQSYHEAAIVDGAGPVRRFFKIVLPMITPILFFNLINQTIGSFQAFNSSYLITQGKPLNTTLYYGVHLYNRSFIYGEMGYGSAMAWFMLLVIALLTALIFRSSSAWVYYESESR